MSVSLVRLSREQAVVADLEGREKEEEENQAVEHMQEAPVWRSRPFVHALRPKVQDDLDAQVGVGANIG